MGAMRLFLFLYSQHIATLIGAALGASVVR